MSPRLGSILPRRKVAPTAIHLGTGFLLFHCVGSPIRHRRVAEANSRPALFVPRSAWVIVLTPDGEEAQAVGRRQPSPVTNVRHTTPGPRGTGGLCLFCGNL